MTRFARAKGSKASNEKAPEDSTPWEVMKEQLLQAKKEKEDSKNRQEAEQQRIKNYENFLKEQKVQKRKATWCDFPETQIENPKSENALNKKKKKNKHVAGNIETSQLDRAGIRAANGDEETLPKKKKNKNKNISNASQIQAENCSETSKTEINCEDTKDPTLSKKKKKNKNKISDNSNTQNIQQQEIRNETNDVTENKDKTHKKNKNKNKNNAVSESAHSFNEKNGSQPAGYMEHKNNNAKPMKKKKDKKRINGTPQRRKDVNDKSFQIIINGAEVELERVDGFPVMKKDAERLNDLRKNMIQKGIPKSEIQRTMKLERRRAEKALARVRKQVCYNCRKGGHNLSDCPELKSKIPDAEVGEGICFKCGSTEHRQFECKVQRDKEFRFATCFICKEPGHIARQCPDNPKGLYPNGGCCKLCGDVTHLRKDCPTVVEKKEDKSIKLSTLDSTDDVEGISQQTSKLGSDEPTKKVKKITF